MSASRLSFSLPDFATFTRARSASRLFVAIAALFVFTLAGTLEARASHLGAMNAQVDGTSIESNCTATNPTITANDGQFTFSFQAYGADDTFNVTFTCTGTCDFTPANFSIPYNGSGTFASPVTLSNTQTFGSGTFQGTIRIDSPDSTPDYDCGANNSFDQDAPSFPITLVVGAPASSVTAGQLLISELRFRGPNPANEFEDEFIEIFNNTNSDITVDANGFAIVGSDGVVRCTIPATTVIPRRGHFLCANSDGYSLGGYPAGPNTTVAPAGPTTTATPDATFTADLPQGGTGGVAIFNTATPAGFTMANRLDAAGEGGAPALYREGAGLTVSPNNTQHTYYRTRLIAGTQPFDTDNNTADFSLVDAQAESLGGRLGAPGPENLTSPVRVELGTRNLDTGVSSTAVPNRERRSVPVTNGPLGTLEIRRTFTNTTGAPITKLRFRVTDITTLGTAPTCGSGSSLCADVRALTSTDEPAVATSAGPVSTFGVTLEEPPAQPSGGGYNSSLDTRVITLETPLANGDSINIHFTLGIVRGGTFRFFVSFEAVPEALPPSAE